MTIKIAHIGDMHFRSKHLDVVQAAWIHTVNDIIEKKVNIVAIPGDIFDTYNVAGKEASFGTVFSAFAEPLQLLVNNGIKIILLTGNHDLPWFGQKSALEPLKYFQNVLVFDKPSTVFLENVNFICLPWVFLKSRDELDVILQNLGNSLRPNVPNIFLGHCDVEGAAEQYYSSVGGEFKLTAQDLMDLKCDAYCLNHIHKRQFVLKDKYGEKLCFAGSLVQNNFGEEGNPTGYRLLEIQ